ncbi:hypothetical protein TWF718_010897 [Orbilia javanica]|uniref:Uncharacterized protein n=1 Tax=Orbilia javanica TaxID=47235 RepID=A0AAN8RC22_9PEZI
MNKRLPEAGKVDVPGSMRALENIPYWIKRKFPDYRAGASGFSLSWKTDGWGEETWPPYRTHQYQVPGTPEPYYLEGPDINIDPPGFLDEKFGDSQLPPLDQWPHLPGGSGEVFKREVAGLEDDDEDSS